MAEAQYPKEMRHPDGSTVRFAYNPDDESRILADDVRFRAEHAEAHSAALEGRAIRALAPDPERRGPGRPRNPENV